MNVHTIRKTILCSRNLIPDFFSYFESIKSYGGWNVIIKVWVVEILSKFKRKELGNHHSKVYEPKYHWKENFMLYQVDSRLFFLIFNRSKVMAV